MVFQRTQGIHFASRWLLRTDAADKTALSLPHLVREEVDNATR